MMKRAGAGHAGKMDASPMFHVWKEMNCAAIKKVVEMTSIFDAEMGISGSRQIDIYVSIVVGVSVRIIQHSGGLSL